MNMNIDSIVGEELRRTVSLSTEFHLFKATYEYPGYVAVQTKVFEFRLGQHSWSYCGIDMLVPLDPRIVHVPFPNNEIWDDPGPEPDLDEYETDVLVVATRWAIAIRTWMEEQRVRQQYIP